MFFIPQNFQYIKLFATFVSLLTQMVSPDASSMSSTLPEMADRETEGLFNNPEFT